MNEKRSTQNESFKRGENIVISRDKVSHFPQRIQMCYVVHGEKSKISRNLGREQPRIFSKGEIGCSEAFSFLLMWVLASLPTKGRLPEPGLLEVGHVHASAAPACG